MQTLVLIFAALMVMDIVQTWFFPRFGLREGNRWLAKIMSQDGFDELFFAKYVVFLAVFAAAGEGLLPMWVMYVAIGLQLAVVAWNAYKMIQGYRRRA